MTDGNPIIKVSNKKRVDIQKALQTAGIKVRAFKEGKPKEEKKEA
jgi:hypothetical protein